MYWNPRHLLTGALFLAGIAGAGGAVAQEFGETVITRSPVDGDLYLAGRTVEVAAEVRGDVVAAGQRINVTEVVTGDIIAAGEVVSLSGPVADDVRAAGRIVTISGPVGDHAVAAGETVTLSAGAVTGGWAWLAGRLVQVFGEVGGELRAAGQEVVIGGTVHGDTMLMGQRVRVLETAHIHGRLSYRSPQEAEIAAGAVVDGDIERLPMPDAEEAAPGAALGAVLVFSLGLLVTGVFYLLAFPELNTEAARTASRHPWAALGVGLAVLLGVPFVAMVLAVTVIGMVPGFALVALYAVLLVAGYTGGVAWLAWLALRKWRGSDVPGRGPLVLAFILVMLALLIAQLVPMAGQLANLLVWLVGIGSLVMVLFSRYRGTSDPGST